MGLFKRKQNGTTDESAATPTRSAAAPGAGVYAKGSSGDVKIYDVSESTAAMIMAIVADTSGIPVNQLKFKSIKEVKA